MKRKQANKKNRVRMVVVGVGGGGCNAVNRMIFDGIRNVSYVTINTDSFALRQSGSANKIQLGSPGVGTGGSVKRGELAATEAAPEIKAALRNADLVFVVAGLGGGTGTGAAPVVAEMAQEAGAFTVGVVTYPFSFEGIGRMQVAKDGMQAIREQCSTMITIPNDCLLELTDNISLQDSFAHVDNVLKQAVKNITEVVNVRGEINVDFADVKTVLSEGGASIMSAGYASGEDMGRIAAEMAVNANELNLTTKGARSIIFNVTAGPNVSLYDIDIAANIIKEASHPDVNLIFGKVTDYNMSNEMRITLIASGCSLVDPSPKTETQRVDEIVERVAPTHHMPTRIRKLRARHVHIDRPFRQPVPAYTVPGTAVNGGRFEQTKWGLPAFLRN